jgi:hypothetical protein
MSSSATLLSCWKKEDYDAKKVSSVSLISPIVTKAWLHLHILLIMCHHPYGYLCVMHILAHFHCLFYPPFFTRISACFSLQQWLILFQTTDSISVLHGLCSRAALDDLHSKLPDLFPGITSSTADGIPVQHLGMFSCDAQLRLGSAAMRGIDFLFKTVVEVPPRPAFTEEDDPGQQRAYILDWIFTQEGAGPGIVSTTDLVFDEVATAVESWVSELTDSVDLEMGLLSKSLPPSCPIDLIRALAYLSHLCKKEGRRMADIYERSINLISCFALHQHCTLVLSSLTSLIDKECGCNTRLKELTANMNALMTEWVNYFPSAAEYETTVKHYVFSCC